MNSLVKTTRYTSLIEMSIIASSVNSQTSQLILSLYFSLFKDPRLLELVIILLVIFSISLDRFYQSIQDSSDNWMECLLACLSFLSSCPCIRLLLTAISCYTWYTWSEYTVFRSLNKYWSVSPLYLNKGISNIESNTLYFYNFLLYV